MEKTNINLVNYCYAQLNKPYWFGTVGQISTPELLRSKRKQYPTRYLASDFALQMGVKVHDCAGLIKAFLMGDGEPDSNVTYNAKYDYSANAMIKKCPVTGAYKDIPEIVGLMVWKSGHAGVYVGNGWCIEAKGHKYGVVKTNDTKWSKWGMLPNDWITYVTYREFLTNMYKVLFNRKPDDAGMKFWLNKLTSKTVSLDNVIKAFFDSLEYKNKNVSDGEFLMNAYQVFFNRVPDTTGAKYWLEVLKTHDRNYVLDGFCNSSEWKVYSKQITAR